MTSPGPGAPAGVEPVRARRTEGVGQERFADVVERFANGYVDATGITVDPDVVKRWQEELDRNVRRLRNFAQMVGNPTEPRVGATPRQEVYRKNKSRLYRYESRRTHRTPVLFVPNLGISRPYIFDLLPRGSFVEHMTQEGFDFYLLDWGVFGPEDNGLTLEACVTKILPRMAQKVLETSGADELSVLGYCMGAPLSASFLGSHPEVPVRNFINMAGPIDFSQVGLFGLWLDKKYFNVDRFIDTLGSVPADMVKAGFKLLKPTMDLSTNLNLWWNLWNDKYVEGFTALNKWANEYVAFPGEFFRQWVRDFYQENKLYRGTLSVGGRPARLESIEASLFVVGAKEDYIAPPACVRALVDVVGSRDKEYVELPGGHISLIAGRGAAAHCWPKVSGWLAPRSS
jgi:polyhydroxyalkanoate synthase